MTVDKNGNRIAIGLDVSTQTIGVCVLLEDGSENGKIIELTHVSPKASKKMDGIEQLFVKKRAFGKFIEKYKDLGVDDVIIEEPLLRSNNINTCGTLLRFNGMISDCIYDTLGVVPKYISSYDARKYSFPELMSVRKYGKDGNIYPNDKIRKEIRQARLVLFGGYDWTVDKKSILQDKVSQLFPEIQWIYDKDGELKKENFDASDSYVACLGYLNKTKYGEMVFKVSNIKESKGKIDYDLEYWDRKEHRQTRLN